MFMFKNFTMFNQLKLYKICIEIISFTIFFGSALKCFTVSEIQLSMG